MTLRPQSNIASFLCTGYSDIMHAKRLFNIFLYSPIWRHDKTIGFKTKNNVKFKSFSLMISKYINLICLRRTKTPSKNIHVLSGAAICLDIFITSQPRVT